MIHYTTEQLAAVIALPIVTILLFWTAAIFQRNRKNWGPYDIPILSILVLSIVRNMTVLAYTLFVILSQNTFDLDYCSAIIWIFNSIHTFQASALTTLAVIALFAVKLHRKQQQLRHFLTSTHVIYHLFCLTTLCACVGVAAILAQDEDVTKHVTIFDVYRCKFMPFDLNVKFNVFIIVLHAFLATVSVVTFTVTCFNHYRAKRQNRFDYLKKSTSDLSDLSLNNNNDNKSHYYDTYTIQRNMAETSPSQPQIFYCHNRDVIWNSDVSNISTTVSSTNSRRPCLMAQKLEHQQHLHGDDINIDNNNRTGLETMHPVLIVCYLFYHLPIIVLCIYPNLVNPWPVSGVALWLGLVQDLLIPIGLSIVDSRFCKWISNVYRCGDKIDGDKLPHVGLDGKFRTFNSPPQSLDIVQPQTQVNRNLQAVEHRFPITNGSLYTSIDGRLPVIHNYRRHKDPRGILTKLPEMTHTSHLRRPECIDSTYHHRHTQQGSFCRNCETDLCPSHSNLHHLSPHYQINQKFPNNCQPPKRVSLSEESLINQDLVIRNSRNLVRLNKMRLCKSEDSLADLNLRVRPSLSFKNTNSESIISPSIDRDIDGDDSTSDDDDFTSNNRNFDTASSQSSFSITTEANCDFEFYQNRLRSTKIDDYRDDYNFLERTSAATNVNKITRSSSKRSLENFQAFLDEIDENEGNSSIKLKRSNSYMTLEDRNRGSKCKKLLRSGSKLSDCTHNFRQKIKSVEYLPSSNASTVFIEDVFYFNYPKSAKNGENVRNYVGSVPDLKKVFISEYI